MKNVWLLLAPLLISACTPQSEQPAPVATEILTEKTDQTLKDAQIGDATLSFTLVKELSPTTRQVVARNIPNAVALNVDFARPIVEEFIKANPNSYSIYLRLEPREPADEVVNPVNGALRTGPMTTSINLNAPLIWAGGAAFSAKDNPYDWAVAVTMLQDAATKILANRAMSGQRMQLMLSVYDQDRFHRSTESVMLAFNSAMAPTYAQGGPWLGYRAWTITY